MTFQGRLKICILYDIKGWAWYHRANAIKRHIHNPNIQIDIALREDAYKHIDDDFVFLFGPYGVSNLARFPACKRIVGSSNPYSVRHMEKLLREGYTYAGAVNSLWQFDYLISRNDVYYLPNGVDTDLFYPLYASPAEFSGCWVGNARAYNDKGLEIIQEGMRLAGVKLNICDIDTQKNSSAALAHEVVRDNFYHKSAFYVCMSRFEGTPNPGLEALACGLPVISTPVGNLQDIIKNGYNGYLINRDPEALKDAIDRLKHADWQTMSANARNSVLNGWRWVDQARRYERMFLELWKRRYTEGTSRIADMDDTEIQAQYERLVIIDGVVSQSLEKEKALINTEWEWKSKTAPLGGKMPALPPQADA